MLLVPMMRMKMTRLSRSPQSLMSSHLRILQSFQIKKI